MPPIRRLNVDIFIVTGLVVATFDDVLAYDDRRSLSDHSFTLVVEVCGGRDRRNKGCGNGCKSADD
jgi:hypothetical protein